MHLSMCGCIMCINFNGQLRARVCVCVRVRVCVCVCVCVCVTKVYSTSPCTSLLCDITSELSVPGVKWAIAVSAHSGLMT